MTIKISGNYFEGNGTGIKAKGKLDGIIKENVFKNNKRDIELFIKESSDLEIKDNEHLNYEISGISLEVYENKIDEVIYKINDQSYSLSEEEKNTLITLLEELKTSKESPSKIKKIMNEIYDIAKNTGVTLLVEYLKYNFFKSN